jgi:hypothetical protein
MGFHASSVELKGAEAACQKGERLVVVPDETYFREFTEVSAPLQKLETEDMALFSKLNKCTSSSAAKGKPQTECALYQKKITLLNDAMEVQSNMVLKWSQNHPINTNALGETLMELNRKGASIDSLIISGHDGGGHFYGDLGNTSKEAVFELAAQYPEQFAKMKSVILMGCWSTVPNQVDTWKANFPSLKVIAGFGGSAPSAVEKAGGEYISGILNVQDSFTGTTEQQALAKLKTIADINYITAAVFVDPTKNCTQNTSGYYAIFAATENATESYKHGINNFKIDSDVARRERCEAVASNYSLWNPLRNYIAGATEPTNNAELTGIYNEMRQNEDCFEKGLMPGYFTPNQVLMLRFFQGTKNNFGKYFKDDIASAYAAIDAQLSATPLLITPADAKTLHDMIRLSPDSLPKLTRAQTLQAISDLAAATSILKNQIDVSKVTKLESLADTYLYQMKCLDDTWHEYDEHATLAPPTCGPAAP